MFNMTTYSKLESRNGLYRNLMVESFWGYRTSKDVNNFDSWDCDGGVVFVKNQIESIITIRYKRFPKSSYYIADISFYVDGLTFNFYYNTNMYHFVFSEDPDDVFEICSKLSIHKDEFTRILLDSMELVRFISVVCFVSPTGTFNIDRDKLKEIVNILNKYGL